MADSSGVKYRVIPSSEDHSDIHDTRPGGADHTIGEWSRVSAEARAKWTYFLLGCAVLLPWNALINGTPFFLSRLAGSPFYPAFSSYLSSVYTFANLIFQLYSTITSKQSSPTRRIFVTIIAMIFLVTSLCLSTFARGTPSAFFSFALFNAAAQAIMSGYLCTAVYAGASLLGASFLQTVISGQAAIGVAVSAVQVVSSVISLWGPSLESVSKRVLGADSEDDHAEELAARIFFGVSAIFLCITLVVYAWLARQPFYRSAVGALEPRCEVPDPNEHARLVTDGRRNPLTPPNSHVYRTFEQNSIFMFAIAYVFAVTLAVFPAITVRVRSVNPSIHPLLFTAIHFLVFNIGDLVGRYSCSFPRLIVWSAKKILAMSLLRTLFIPLILLCNIQRLATTIPVSPIINSDTLFMVILLAMGYTNGYVSSLALLAVSSLEHNPRLRGWREDVDVAATLGGSFVIVGLAFGAISSFGVQAMI